MWTDLRQELEQIRHALRLSPQDFAPLPYTTPWRSLEERIYQAFCVLSHPTARYVWLWEYFKPGTYAQRLAYEEPLVTLTGLLEPSEHVWVMLNETVQGADKFWFYHGTQHAIYTVLQECYHLDEIYLISKKYDWLLCLNHHDVLYGVGPRMIAKIQALDSSFY